MTLIMTKVELNTAHTRDMALDIFNLFGFNPDAMLHTSDQLMTDVTIMFINAC